MGKNSARVNSRCICAVFGTRHVVSIASWHIAGAGENSRWQSVGGGRVGGALVFVCTQAGLAAIARFCVHSSRPSRHSQVQAVVVNIRPNVDYKARRAHHVARDFGAHGGVPRRAQDVVGVDNSAILCSGRVITPHHPGLQTKARTGDCTFIPQGLRFGLQVGWSWTFSVGAIVAECVCARQPQQDVWRRSFKYWMTGLGTQHRLFDQSINQNDFIT